MNDKLQKLYNLYKQQGLITDATSFEKFSNATPEQQTALYNLGVDNGLFLETGEPKFKNLFEESKPKEPSTWDNIVTYAKSLFSSDEEDVKKKEQQGSTASPSEESSLASQSKPETATQINGQINSQINTQTQTPNFFAELLNSITPELIDEDEDDIEDKLGKKLEPYGVKVEQDKRFREAIKLSVGEEGTPNYKEISVPVDNFFADNDKKSSIDLKKWLAENTNKEKIAEQESVASEFQKATVNEQAFNKALGGINADLISQDEESIVPQLTAMFGNYGIGDKKFQFEEVGATDNIKVTAPNGKVFVTEVDAFTTKGDEKIAADLKKFMEDNKPVLLKAEDNLNKYATTFLSEKEMEDATKSFSIEADNFKNEVNSVLLEKKALEKDKGKMSPEEYNQRTQALNNKIAGISDKESKLNSNKLMLDKSLAKYVEWRAEQGGVVGSIWNSFIGGYGSQSSGITGLFGDIALSIAPADVMIKDYKGKFLEQALQNGVDVPSLKMSESEFDKWTETLPEDVKNKIESKVVDNAKKEFKKEVAYPSGKALVKTLGVNEVTPEYMQKAQKTTVLQSGAMGVAGSLPAIAGSIAGPGGGKLTVAQFALQGYDATMQEMSGEGFEDIPENEKYLVAVPVAILNGVLEEYGFRNLVGKSSVTTSILSNVMGKAGKKATASTFKELVENEVESQLSRGLLTLGAAGLSEAETGGMQQLGELAIKDIYNRAREKQLFQTPNGVSGWLDEIGESAKQEAIGGMIMGSIGAVSTAASPNNYNGISDKTLKELEMLRDDETFRSAFVANLKYDIANGKKTKEQAEAELDGYNKSISIYNQIPTDITDAAKRKAFGLLAEKTDLESKIQGKDESLTKKDRERIAEIKNELSKLPEMTEEGAASYSVNGEQMSEEDFAEAVGNMTADEIKSADIKATNASESVTNLLKDVATRSGVESAPMMETTTPQEKIALSSNKKMGDLSEELQNEIDDSGLISYGEIGDIAENKSVVEALDNKIDYHQLLLEKENEKDNPDESVVNENTNALKTLNDLKTKVEQENIAVSPAEAAAAEAAAKAKSPAKPKTLDKIEEGEVRDFLLNELEYYEGRIKEYKEITKKAANRFPFLLRPLGKGAEKIDNYLSNRSKVKKIEQIKNNPEQYINDEIERYEKYKEEEGEDFEYQPYLDQLYDLQSKLQEENAIQAPAEAQPAIPEEIASLQDDAGYTVTVKTLEEVPEQFRDRAEKSKTTGTVTTREKILGLPIGKKTTTPIDFGYTYTLTGKEAKDYAIQKSKSEEGVLRTEQSQVGLPTMGQGNTQQATTQEGVTPTKSLEEQVTELESMLTDDESAQFMLESEQSQAKQEMIDEATKLMEQEEKNGFSEKAFDATNPEPTVKPISIEIKENTRLADKVKRMGLKELIGKKINLVMADQLKVGDISIGKKILKRMGGPFFPLIDELFGKVAWASMDETAASRIINGAIKSDYTVVYNMNPSAIDSNAAMRDTFIAMVRKMPKVERDAIISKMVNQIKGKKFGKKTEQVQNDILKVKTLSDFEKMMSELDVNTKAAIINMILPSKDVKAETEIGIALQEKGITIESIREINIEQFVADLPAGALTMVLEVQDKNGNKITEATKKEAFITPEQQKEEGLPSHDNYPIYIRGKAVAILSETVPFWNILKDSLNTINVKVAKIVKAESGRAFTSKEARSAEMRSASMSASAAKKVSNIAATEYEKFVSLLSRAFPTVEIVANQKEFDKLINELGAKALVTKDQNIYGAVYNGKVYLNPSLENYNTPIHEFGHIWLNVARNVKPELYKKGLSLVSGSPYMQQIRDNKDYQRVIKNMIKEGASESEIETYIREEALATAIGDRGESFVIAAQKKNFKEWLNKLYSVVRKLTGISKYTAEQLETITFDEFTKAVAVDLMSGNEIFTKLQVKEFSKQLQLSTGKKDAASIVKIGRGSGFSDDAIRIVLGKKGFSNSQIDEAMKVKEAGTKIVTNEEMMPGYDRMMAQVDNIIEKGLNRNTNQKNILDNVISYIQGSKAYENATAQQQEEIIRDVKKAFGEKIKPAPSAKRLLGFLKDVKKVTMDEMSLLKKQFKDMAKGAKTAESAINKASRNLTESLKDLVKKGDITTKQMLTVLRKFSKTNLLDATSIDNFVNYMTKVFADADYADKISKAYAQLKVAKKNIKTKIGISEELHPLLSKIFSVNPNLIPDAVFEKYLGLVDMFGQKKQVLKLQNKQDVVNLANEIINSIDEELSLSEELSDRFSNYADKVVDADGKVDYAATIQAMVKDDIITEDEAKIMRKYKSKIFPSAKPTPKTDAELAQEKQDLLTALNGVDIDTENLPTHDEREIARKLDRLIRSNAVNEMTNEQLTNLLKVIDNINNGYLPHYSQLMLERLNALNNGSDLKNAIDKAKPLSLTKIYSNLKSILTRKESISTMVVRSPLYYIDQVFGNFKSKDIFNSLFKATSEAHALFDSNITAIQNKLDKAEEDVAKSLSKKILGINFKNIPNKVIMSKFKMMTYLIQLEYQSNPNSKQVNPASEYLKATIKHIDEGKSSFGERDANMLQKILDTYKDTDGNIDIDKLYNSFNAAEKKAIATIREVNESLREKAMHTSAIIRGDKINPLENYVHLNVLHDTQPDDAISGITSAEAYNNTLKPSTKAKSLIARTGKVAPLNFDVFASAHRGAKFVLMDYYLTEPIRTARKTINEATAMMEQGGRIPKEKRQILNAISNAFEETTENILNNAFVTNSFGDEVVNYMSKSGYRAVLASVPRFIAELTSNIGGALFMNPKAFATGYKYRDIVMSSDAVKILSNVASKQTNRIFPNEALAGRLIDSSIMSQASGIKGGRAKSDVANVIQTIYNNSLKKYKNSVETLADALISTPDKIVMRPMWIGSFANEFKKLTGKDVDFNKIANNDEAYMLDNKDAIDDARDVADQLSVFIGTTKNPYMDILKGKVKANQSPLARGLNMFNNYMTSFAIYEYTTARTGIMAAMGNGSLSRKQGVALLAGVTTRMVLYTLLAQTLSSGMVGLFVDDEDEEDEKSLLQKVGQALTSTFTSLILGRDFGNVTKTIVNYGLERVNENYLDFLRKGDYDPYKDAIQYSIIPPDVKGKKTTIADYIINMSGPFAPTLKTADLIARKLSEDPKKTEASINRKEGETNVRIPLEVLGNLGLVPLYKDIRKITMKSIYKDLENVDKQYKVKETEKRAENIEKIKIINRAINSTTDQAVVNELMKMRREARMEMFPEKMSDEAIIILERKKKREKASYKNLLGGYDTKTDLKRYNPDLYEQNFGEDSKYYKTHEAEMKAEKLFDAMMKKTKDEKYGYTPTPKKKKSKKRKKNSDGSYKSSYFRSSSR